MKSKARKITKQKKEAWRKAVKENWDNKCAKCNKTEHLDTHHVSYRKELKYNPDIGILLCKSCHKLGHGSAHKEAIIFYKWFSEEYPKKYDKMLKLIEEAQ